MTMTGFDIGFEIGVLPKKKLQLAKKKTILKELLKFMYCCDK